MELAAKLFDQQPELHAQEPRALSLTQSTELGTVYTADEIRVLADFAHQRSCFLHMDGARFANAIAALGFAPKLITWQSGVDVLCFVGRDNWLAERELVVL